jgi:hypothetical protein
MSIVSIVALAALIGAFLFLLLSLRVPPLYGPPEKNDKVEAEPPNSQNPHAEFSGPDEPWVLSQMLPM